MFKMRLMLVFLVVAVYSPGLAAMLSPEDVVKGYFVTHRPDHKDLAMNYQLLTPAMQKAINETRDGYIEQEMEAVNGVEPVSISILRVYKEPSSNDLTIVIARCIYIINGEKSLERKEAFYLMLTNGGWKINEIEI